MVQPLTCLSQLVARFVLCFPTNQHKSTAVTTDGCTFEPSPAKTSGQPVNCGPMCPEHTGVSSRPFCRVVIFRLFTHRRQSRITFLRRPRWSRCDSSPLINSAGSSDTRKTECQNCCHNSDGQMLRKELIEAAQGTRQKIINCIITAVSDDLFNNSHCGTTQKSRRKGKKKRQTAVVFLLLFFTAIINFHCSASLALSLFSLSHT